MLFCDITLIDADFEVLEHAWVGVQGDRIAGIWQGEPPDAGGWGESYDGRGKVLIPALYNLHAHGPMTLLRGWAEGTALQTWLNEQIFPFEARMTPEDDYWGMLLACAELARFGCVSLSDMYFNLPERARAVNALGMKANLCECFTALEPKPFSDYPQHGQLVNFVDEFHGSSQGRILVDACLHSEYLTCEPVVRGVADLARARGLRIHVHAAETALETRQCRERHGGLSPFAYLERCGALDVPVVAAHCVHVTDDDLDIMAHHGVSACHNPASNMKLGSGVAPVHLMLERGVNVVLGTDGVASNNSHNMFRDMYLMALLNKGCRQDPTLVTPRDVLYCATRAGALAQGRQDCGLVKEGFKADLAVLDASGPNMCPMTNALNNLVYAACGSEVVLTMCDGRVVWRDGSWPGVDVEEARHEVARRAERIAGELRGGAGRETP